MNPQSSIDDYGDTGTVEGFEPVEGYDDVFQRFLHDSRLEFRQFATYLNDRIEQHFNDRLADVDVDSLNGGNPQRQVDENPELLSDPERLHENWTAILDGDQQQVQLASLERESVRLMRGDTSRKYLQQVQHLAGGVEDGVERLFVYSSELVEENSGRGRARTCVDLAEEDLHLYILAGEVAGEVGVDIHEETG